MHIACFKNISVKSIITLVAFFFGKSSGSLDRICSVIVPDPFFPTPYKRKKVVWLRKTINIGCGTEYGIKG